VQKEVEGSYDFSNSLIGVKSVTYGLVVIEFVLICMVDKTVLQVSMLRATADMHDINLSASLSRLDTEPLLTTDQVALSWNSTVTDTDTDIRDAHIV